MSQKWIACFRWAAEACGDIAGPVASPPPAAVAQKNASGMVSAIMPGRVLSAERVRLSVML